MQGQASELNTIVGVEGLDGNCSTAAGEFSAWLEHKIKNSWLLDVPVGFCGMAG